MIADSVLGMSPTQLILQKDRILSKEESARVKEIVERLKQNEPIQYILGETEFYSLNLKVAPGVLIPRQETEELVDWILKTTKDKNLKILDIGTGSGCIPVALKKNLPAASLTALDVSTEALRIAQSNALENKVEVQFLHADVLNWENREWDLYDIIVSNPPYVRHLEKKLMEANVLEHEPQLALFVSDDDPLLFYREIAQLAMRQLNSGGRLFFEINEFLGAEMLALLNDLGFRDIELRKDLNGKDRMLMCTK